MLRFAAGRWARSSSATRRSQASSGGSMSTARAARRSACRRRAGPHSSRRTRRASAADQRHVDDPGEEGRLRRWQRADRHRALRGIDVTTHYHRAQIKDFLDAIQEGRPPLRERRGRPQVGGDRERNLRITSHGPACACRHAWRPSPGAPRRCPSGRAHSRAARSGLTTGEDELVAVRVWVMKPQRNGHRSGRGRAGAAPGGCARAARRNCALRCAPPARARVRAVGPTATPTRRR